MTSPRRRAARRRLSPLWLVLVGGCSFQASCGGKTLDSKRGEAMIAGRFKDQTGLDVKVTCPTGIKLEQGAGFDCALSHDGLPGKVHVTQSDDQGNVTFTLTEGYLQAAKVEAAIGAQLKAKTGAEVAIACGDRVRASVPGTFRCTGQAPDGQPLAVEVTITDRLGSIDWKLVQPAGP